MSEPTLLEQVRAAQPKHTRDWQEQIEDGSVWRMEGAMGRAAMETLKSGECFLPEKSFRDYWGNKVPSRNEVKPGTTGSLENCRRFYNL